MQAWHLADRCPPHAPSAAGGSSLICHRRVRCSRLLAGGLLGLSQPTLAMAALYLPDLRKRLIYKCCAPRLPETQRSSLHLAHDVREAQCSVCKRLRPWPACAGCCCKKGQRATWWPLVAPDELFKHGCQDSAHTAQPARAATSQSRYSQMGVSTSSSI